MSYTPTEWVTGDIVTAEKLNKLENAVANGVVPEYTYADKGKVLTLGEGSESETVVVVPEQTVTIVEGGSYLTNADFSSVSVGTSGTMTIDTDSFQVIAQNLDGMIGFMAEEGGESYAIATDGTDVFFETSITGTHTVSLTASVPSVEPKWEEIIPDYRLASEGDVLTIENGVPVWKQTNHINS